MVKIRSLLTTFLIAIQLSTSPLLATENTQAQPIPFGDQVSDKIYNYHRHTPFIATSGKLATGGLEELKALGFTHIIDLRTAAEGTDIEAAAAKVLDLNYQNLPVARTWPSQKTMNQFANLMDRANSHTTLLHCGSANRVGMMWSYYQIEKGMEIEQAILEGRTIGMKPSLETALRQHLPK